MRKFVQPCKQLEKVCLAVVQKLVVWLHTVAHVVQVQSTLQGSGKWAAKKRNWHAPFYKYRYISHILATSIGTDLHITTFLGPVVQSDPIVVRIELLVGNESGEVVQFVMVVNTGKFKASSRTPACCSGLVPSATLTVAVANELVAVLSTVGMVKNRISIGTLRAMRSWRSNILKVESHHSAKKKFTP